MLLVAALTFLGSAPIGAAAPAASRQTTAAIERCIDAMTPEERIGQLLLVSFEGTTPDADLRKMVGQWGVGGVVFFARNVKSSAQTKALAASIRRLSRNGLVPFIAIDHEGGTVLRLHKGVPALPANMALGATGSPALARRAGAEVGKALRTLGFTMNFAPVLDVYGNPASAIGTRAFGDRPELVAVMGAAFVEGQSLAHVVSVAKHFVGEGDAAGDSHFTTPWVLRTSAEIEAIDLVPFRGAIAHGLPAVMTSHVAAPALTGEGGLPMTLSRAVVTDLLRERLGFDGLVITDALEMTSVMKDHEYGELAIEAVEAGADMILSAGTAKDREEVFHRLLEAYEGHRISEERVRASLRRILGLKASFGIADPLDDSPPVERSNIAETIAARSITLVSEGRNALASLATATLFRSAFYVGPNGPLSELLHSHSFVLDRKIESDEIQQIAEESLAAIGESDVIVGAAENRHQAEIIRRIAAARPKARLIAISLGNPHDLEQLDRCNVCLAAWSTSAASQKAVVAVLRGEALPQGSLSVALDPERFPAAARVASSAGGTGSRPARRGGRRSCTLEAEREGALLVGGQPK